jgi:general secretion pathway protein H
VTTNHFQRGGLTLPGGAAIRGFTLLEVMVVIVIIGIIVSQITISFSGQSPEEILKTEARRFASLAQLASEEALLSNALIGIAVDHDGYQFLRRQKDKWQASTESVFRKRSLPDEVRIALDSDYHPAEKEEEKLAPSILILPSGEITPFHITFISEATDDRFYIEGSENGSIDFQHTPAL